MTDSDDQSPKGVDPDNEPTIAADSSLPPAPGSGAAPPWIGDYRILGVLGRGGMGVVYEAEQQSPVRIVALKVILGEATVDELRISMFRREVEVLARLDHPLIAGIYESGRTDEGQHFFAMELVRGEELSTFLRRGKTPLDGGELRRRLTMFAEIAEAVHYAHQRGVIHRDLKPSNLIVAEGDQDSTPHVKILDFGLARITDADVAATRVTEVGTIRGTLSYMSPEQARGRPDDIDVRTDVYALGVILYEMLSGALPHDLSSLSVVAALRAIEHESPRPLREVWKGARRIDGDIETIATKALEKDVDDRYGSAAALADDVRRYLGSQPILARAPSTIYQLRKLVRRNPLPAALAASVLVLLIAFAGTMAFQANRIASERDRAQAEADKSAAINQFLQATLETANPYAGGEREVTILEALDLSAARIETVFAGQPIVEAEVRQTMGATYRNLGQFEKAEPLLRRALDLRIEHQGAHHADTATAWGDLSRFYHLSFRFEEAVEAALAGIEAQRAALGPNHPKLGERLDDLGFAYRLSGRIEEAEIPVREAIEIGRAQPEGPSYILAESLGLMADILQTKGEIEQAEPLATEALEIYRVTLGENNPHVNLARTGLSIIMMTKGDFDGAEKLLLEVVESQKRLLGDGHAEVAVAIENLGNVYFRAGRLDRTIEMLAEAAAIRKAAFGPEHHLVGRTLCNKGMVLWRADRFEEAEAALREGTELMRAGLGDHPDVAYVLTNLANLLTKRGKPASAEAPLRDAFHIRRAVLGEADPLTARSRIDLGLNLVARSVKVPEARKLLQDGVTVLTAVAGEDDPRVKVAREALGNGKG